MGPETAEILAEQLVKDNVLLHGDGVQLETRLRERWFGELESKGDDSYDLVWQHDAQSAEHQEFGCGRSRFAFLSPSTNS